MNVPFDPEKLSYKADLRGYTISYDGCPIGGAGTEEPSIRWHHRHADLKGFTEAAQREIAQLREGRGQARFLEAIARIENEKRAQK